MDPDLVRQQEEAEREAAAALAKTRADKISTGLKQETVVAPLARMDFAAQDVLVINLSQPGFGEVEKTPAEPTRPHRESAFVRLDRFLSYGLAGGISGGAIGVAAFDYWQLPPHQAQLVILGPAGALAIICALASLMVTNPGTRS